jgi:hypothetical protein
MTSQCEKKRRVVIIEWRHEGHRFGYVAAIARASTAAGLSPVLLTSADARSTREFSTHLSDVDDLGVADLRRPISPTVGFARALLQARRLGAIGVVVPEVDTLLPSLLLTALLLRRRLPITGIVMRPPRQGAGTMRSAWYRAKAAMISADRFCPGLDLLLLEDPLADEDDLVWPRELVLGGRRLDDPADLYRPAHHASLPQEIAQLTNDRALVTVMGVIDHRKQIPLVLEAWRQGQLGARATLLIAGKQREGTRPALEQASAEDRSIVTVDRYLSNEEMGAIIERSSVMLLLYDVGTSSGMLTTSAAVGRWTVVRADTRVGRIALRSGFGIAAHPSGGAVAQAISTALDSDGQPAPRQLPSCRTFGDRVLRMHVEH